MNYWLGVISKENTLKEFTQSDKWFCLPIGASVGDKIVMYVTARLAKKLGGAIGIYELTHKSPNDSLCKKYGGYSNPLQCYELNLSVSLNPPISLESLKANPTLRRSQAIRRSFQGTVFKLSTEEFEAVLSLR